VRALARPTVLQLIDTGGPGGAETIFAQLVSGLEGSGWDVVPVVPERDWLFEALSRSGRSPVELASERSFDLRYLYRLARLAGRERADLIHAHLLGTSVYGSLVGRLVGLPVVCTFHGRPDSPAGNRFAAAKLWCIDRRANRLTFVSRSLRDYFLGQNRVIRAPLHVIYNGIDVSAFRDADGAAFRHELGIQAGDIMVGAVGNVRPSKDYGTFIRSAALLRARSPRYRFVVAGDVRSPLFPGLLELRDALGLRGVLDFLGFRDDVARILPALDVFVVSSTDEGFSLAVAEAMAAGTPVVATRCGGPEEIIVDDESGLLVPPGSPEALASAVAAVAEDPGLRHRLTVAAGGVIDRRFRVESMVAAYGELYRQCLGPGTPGRSARTGAGSGPSVP
jgi:glycosyltransferase involved in cell wall biosynthesis